MKSKTNINNMIDPVIAYFSQISELTNYFNSNYDNHRVDYDTGLSDSEGNPIYLSEISSDGGNNIEPGVYMVYWSKLGVINQTRIE